MLRLVCGKAAPRRGENTRGVVAHPGAAPPNQVTYRRANPLATAGKFNTFPDSLRLAPFFHWRVGFHSAPAWGEHPISILSKVCHHRFITPKGLEIYELQRFDQTVRGCQPHGGWC